MYDPAAESAVLAAVLDQPELVKEILDVPGDTFVTPINRLIYEAIVELVDAKEPFDHLSVSRRTGALAASRTIAADATTKIMANMGRATSIGIGFHLDRLLGLSRARAVEGIAGQLNQYIEEATRLDEPALLNEGIESTLRDLAATQDTHRDRDAEPPISLGDLLLRPAEYDWLIPGVFERMDRLILTGLEGTGKSVLLSQIALTTAAGIHPFLGTQVGPHRNVLVVDAENSERQTIRRYDRNRKMIERVCDDEGVERPDWYSRVRFVLRPEGVELDDPRQLLRIEKAIIAAKPDLVVIGPLYRLHKLNTSDEDAAKELVRILDRLRVKHRFALISEAHVNHGGKEGRALRPTGSSVFLRWPEFGLGLKPAQGTEDEEHPSRVNLVAWRGGREDRVWPSTLEHNFNRLPWVADKDYASRLNKAGYLNRYMPPVLV